MSLDKHRERELTDPKTIRALAHPTRLALLELIVREGTLTATQASALVGESTASTSYHLRLLAKYGFIEPADGGRGRERPWRRAAAGQRWSDVSPDPEVAAAATVLSSVLVEREMASVMRWVEGAYDLPPAWRDAALGSQSILYLTLAELREFTESYTAFLREHGFVDRTENPSQRPEDARPVKVLSLAFPLPPTPSGS